MSQHNHDHNHRSKSAQSEHHGHHHDHNHDHAGSNDNHACEQNESSHSCGHDHDDHHHHHHHHGGNPQKRSANNNRYGLRGNMTIAPRLREVAQDYGLEIVYQRRDNTYRVSSHHGSAALPVLLAPFMNDQRPSDDGTITMDRTSLQKALQFLHQPLHFSAADYAAAQKSSFLSAEKSSSTLDQRRFLHKILRFMTTDSPSIPLYSDDDLGSKATCECHADSEQSMRNDDLWALESELAHHDNHGTHDHVNSAIPGTSYDPMRGFVFQLAPSFRPSFSEPNHAANLQDTVNANRTQSPSAADTLRAQLWAALNEITGHNHVPHRHGTAQSTAEISLNSAQLVTFSRYLLKERKSGLDSIVDLAAFETDIQKAHRAIAQDARSLSGNLSFLRLLHAHDGNIDHTARIKAILEATTTLSPIITSQTMRAMTGHYNFTSRILGKDNPVDALATEFSVLQNVLQSYGQRGKVSAAELQAIGNHFAHVIGFSAHMAESITTALEALDEKPAGAPDTTQALQQAKKAFSRAHNALGAPMPAGSTPVQPRFLSADQQEVLSALRKALHQDGNALTQTARGLGETFISWNKNLIDFATESPQAFAAYSAILAFILINAPETAATTTPEAISQALGSLHFDDGSGFDIPAEALHSLENHVDTLYAEHGENRSCHFEQIGFWQIKHCISDGLIAGNTKAVIENLPFGSNFSNAAGQAAEKTGEWFFNLNVLQNLAHGAFWGYTLKKGYMRGMQGVRSLAELVSPLVDPLASYTSGAVRRINNVAALITGRTIKQAHGSHILNHAIRAPHSDTAQSGALALLREVDPAPFDHETDTEKLAQACMYMLELDDINNDTPTHIPHRVSRDTNNKDIAVSALDLALRELDVTLTYLASQIGIHDNWHRMDLRKRLDDTIEALNIYHEHGDVGQLEYALGENLDRLIGAQLYHTGKSSLYSAAFNNSIAGKDEQQESLTRDYSAWIGRAQRRENLNNNVLDSAAIRANPDRSEAMKRIDLAWKTLGRGAITSVDAIVYAARFAEKGWHATPYKKAAMGAVATAITAGTLGDAAGLQLGAIPDAAIDGLANIGGAITGASLASTIALTYNLLEDTLAIHAASGLAFLAMGAAARTMTRRAAEPAYASFTESRQNTPAASARKIQSPAHHEHNHSHSHSHSHGHTCQHDHHGCNHD